MNTEDKSVFDYIADNLGPAFPLDWSMNKWCEEYSRPNRKTVKRYTVESNLFKPFFDGTRSSKKSGSPQFYDRSEYNHDGIPTELEDFFRSYIDTVTKFTAKKEKNTRLKDILNGESSEFDRVFCRHCVSQASISASSDKDDSYSAFLRKCLYENDAFVSEKISMSWDTVQCRMDTLKKLVLKQPAELQIQHIKNILAFLDMEIATVLPTDVENDVEKPADTPPEKNPMPFTTTLPMEVIQKTRQFTSNAGNGHITYHIPNINFQDPSNPQNTINMETACSKISKMSPERKTLLPAAQEAYKKFLNEHASEKSEFQRQCEHLDGYVYRNSTAITDEYLMGEIESITKSYFSEILSGHNQPFDIRIQMDKFQQSNSSEHFRTLHDIISSYCNQFISRYQQSIASLSILSPDVDSVFSSALLYYYDKTAKHLSRLGEKTLKESAKDEIEQYKNILKNIWPIEDPNTLEIFNKNIQNLTYDRIMNDIIRLCEYVYDYFSISKPYWISEKYVNLALQSYRVLLSCNDENRPGITAFLYNIILTRLILICRISCDYENILNQVFYYYKETSKLINPNV